MESILYIFVLVGALGVIFFAIAFREPPRIPRKDDK
jgi:photosystem II PsbT protein